LIIDNHLSLAFKFLPRTCHPTTKTLKPLNNNQSQKKKKKLNLPNKNIQILKQQSIPKKKKKSWISPTKTFKSLNNNQSQKKEKLESPQQ
jgi:hypothetical protein